VARTTSTTKETPASTKARILGAAEHVFAERGFDGSSTREIAAQAGVNITSLHYHWASKETLYLAVFRDVFERLVAHLQATINTLLAREKDRNVIVDEVMSALIDFFDGHPTVPRLLVRRIVDADAEGTGVEREVLVPAWDVFASWLARLDAGLSDRDARLFMLSMFSVLVMYLLDSPVYRSLLGASVREPAMHEAVRRHVVGLVRGAMPVRGEGT
jgi:AcrR family transcriptional regulator